MAQSGYRYDPLRSYPSQPPYPIRPYSPYAIPSHSPNEPTQSSAGGEATKESYNHNRNVIPGLGLGFANGGSDWQGNRVGVMSQHPSVMEAATSKILPPNISQTTASQARAEPVTVNMAEDDVLGEGELGDIYESRDVENPVIMSQTPQGKGNAVFHGDMDRSDDTSPDAASTARERSGSYSPYLSPREITQSRPSDAQIDAHRATLYQKVSLILTPGEPGVHSKIAQPTSQVSNFLHVDTVAEARKQAQDAILRLWPLNVRYQNYLEEGIDDGLLESLFKELGFDLSASGNMEALDSRNNSSPRPVDASVRELGEAGQNQASETQPDKVPKQDKSEERKDRIARLLAAKNSKASSSVPPLPPPPPSKTSAQSKSQSEKSKLLYQKMEALKKAREARGQKRSLPEEPTTPASTPFTEPHTVLAEAGNASHHVDERRDASVPQEQISDASPGVNGHPHPSIPGLFLSSTPQPSPVQSTTPSRQSAPVNVELSDRPFKRPFGQTRESRPFLIDVSDDEDDAEMDIDSPDQNSSSIHHPVTLSMRAMSFKGTSSFMESGLVRQYSSPIHTPSGMTSDGSAREDLESMNKKIEAMKRRIAEAEARKRAKQSRPQSPALTPSTSHTHEDSSEATASANDVTIHPQSLASIPLPDSRCSSQPRPDESPMGLPKVADIRHERGNSKRRSLSRVATERLPILEARRREQQLKLKLLQSQMASIEKEIQDSLQEEERLKEEVVSAESDVGDEDDTPAELQTLPKATEPSSTEAMDTTSSSSSSEDNERSRNTTPSHVQQLSEKPTRDTISSPAPTSPQETTYDIENAGPSTLMADTANETSTTAADVVEMGLQSRVISSDESHDIIMHEDDSNDGDLEDASDSYEPPEAQSSSSSSENSRASSPFSPAPAEQNTNDSKNEAPDNTTELPVIQQISTAQESAFETGGEADHTTEADASEIPHTGFIPYETPLQYFHAYRFHPEFNKSVAGGLRSLTYSNKIDVKKELCPDELAGQSCSRGKQCDYQHFETMQAPDDHILLQLGAHGNYDEKHKPEYISGLRQLLIEFRNKKIMDFHVISQGIIDYRAQFLKDKSKILPLGNVTI